jgi:hypothetical protein
VAEHGLARRPLRPLRELFFSRRGAEGLARPLAATKASVSGPKRAPLMKLDIPSCSLAPQVPWKGAERVLNSTCALSDRLHRPRVGDATTKKLTGRREITQLPTDPASVEAVTGKLRRRRETHPAPHRPCVGGSNDCVATVAMSCESRGCILAVESLLPPTRGRWGAESRDRRG